MATLKDLCRRKGENKMEVVNNIVLENARIGFRNFAGEAGKFNAAGNRNFCVFLDTDQANSLESIGWNIRWLKPRDPDDQPQAYLQVTAAFNNFPPDIFLIRSNSKLKLDEDNVDILDWAEIQSVDLIIRPYNWEVNGKTGVKAYLKIMYVVLVEDEFSAKYQDTPDSALDVAYPPKDEH